MFGNIASTTCVLGRDLEGRMSGGFAPVGEEKEPENCVGSGLEITGPVLSVVPGDNNLNI